MWVIGIAQCIHTLTWVQKDESSKLLTFEKRNLQQISESGYLPTTASSVQKRKQYLVKNP